uniref:Uncharacterized protein n=1 Tax=Nelumbo nucifera TaxID=4432 RepID=A0A822Z8U5_NELNU|nr:TPA_asm: hypothetical protein HUJ06_015600 [Nelumbo nucifera]
MQKVFLRVFFGRERQGVGRGRIGRQIQRERRVGESHVVIYLRMQRVFLEGIDSGWGAVIGRTGRKIEREISLCDLLKAGAQRHLRSEDETDDARVEEEGIN